MKLVNTGKTDNFGRPIYNGEGQTYVDIDMNDDNPNIHSVSKDGEPSFPIVSFRCSLCKDIYMGYSHNAKPITDGVCCDECNIFVIRERMIRFKNK